MHTIHWEEPFTWENFPIISYELNITNHSLTIPDRETIQMSIPSNASNLTYSFNTNGHNCYGLNIALSASNSIGQSDSSTVHTGHPIGKTGELCAYRYIHMTIFTIDLIMIA